MKVKKQLKGHFFDPVVPQPDFPAMERKLAQEWYQKGVVKKYLEKNKTSKKLFKFLDGPITANNPMGVHHAWGRTYKDLFQRYKNMQGYCQRFQNGFDAQGLWVEVNVEKDMGLKSKRDIENLVTGDIFRSIARFVDLCKQRVVKFAAIQTEQSKRLGCFMDWQHSYITMSDDNNYMIWYFMQKCHEKGLIYEGLDSVPWCPRCATAISNHEILTENYKDVVHTAVTLRYPIAGRRREYLLVWTTTPWTLPSNVAIAVNSQLVYSRVRVGLDIYYLARDRIIPVLGQDVEVLEELTGDRLVNLRYDGPFDDLPAVQTARRENPRTFHATIDGGDMVTAQEGTGLVHIAPGAGHEDFVLGKKHRLSVITSVDENGIFLDGFGKFSGKKAANSAPIITVLKEGDWFFKEEQYRHRYPVCWRCQTELIFRAVAEWYIAMNPLREKMARFARAIGWIPDFAKERELDWIANMDDWLISKKRYWGLALPIWKCSSCGWFTVLSGREELKEKAVGGWKEFSGHSPHRPWIDLVKIRCEKCNAPVSRILDVGNVWLDAGIVPLSTLVDPKTKKVSYLTDKKYWQKWYPFDFITESFPGQFKGWFYALLAMAAVLEDTEPFKTVLGFGTLLGEDGRPMHKSWGNAIEFNQGADKIGVDTMRWMYVKQDPAKNLLFGYHVADQTRRTFHLTLWNIYNFFVTYANFDGWEPAKSSILAGRQANILDKWILVRLAQVVNVVTEALERYDAQTASRQLGEFVNDLSTWYIRRCRDRVGPGAPDQKDKENFFRTMYYVLVTLCKVLAPFIPFMTEVMFRNLTRKESVHLEDWPPAGLLTKQDLELLEAMQHVRAAAEVGHAQRKTLAIKVRQPLAQATFGASVPAPIRGLLLLLADELNVKKIVWQKKRARLADASAKRTDDITVKIDSSITSQLEEEGKVRELVREIQDQRHKQGLGLGDMVNVTAPWFPQNKRLLSWIKQKTLACDLARSEKLGVHKVTVQAHE